MTHRLAALSIMTLAVTLALSACGGGGQYMREGPMPEGGSFTGVWHSPQYGEMQMEQNGNQVIGEYVKDERRGRIQGTAQGRVLRFEWSEQRELVAGRPITTRGRGYFVYDIGDDNDHYIRGEWGHDDSMTGGGPWNAVKDRRRRPTVAPSDGPATDPDSNIEEFDSAGGSSGDSDLGGGDEGGSDSSGGGGGDDLDLGDL